MRVLGIDLASLPDKTAGCLLEWNTGSGALAELAKPLDDRRVTELARSADVVAIDAPLGWPIPFVGAVSSHARGDDWPNSTVRELSYRRTDMWVRSQVGRWPLSVSADRIGIVAFRAARLHQLLRPDTPRLNDGSDGVIEVYPAAALHRWGLPRRGYKRPEGRSERVKIMEGLPRIANVDLGRHEADLIESDDCLDALVAALVGVAKYLGHVDPPPTEYEEAARIEGWIWLPTAGPLTGHDPEVPYA
jgi:predicted nuclease with RNAse H fold